MASAPAGFRKKTESESDKVRIICDHFPNVFIDRSIVTAVAVADVTDAAIVVDVVIVTHLSNLELKF